MSDVFLKSITGLRRTIRPGAISAVALAAALAAPLAVAEINLSTADTTANGRFSFSGTPTNWAAGPGGVPAASTAAVSGNDYFSNGFVIRSGATTGTGTYTFNGNQLRLNSQLNLVTSQPTTTTVHQTATGSTLVAETGSVLLNFRQNTTQTFAGKIRLDGVLHMNPGDATRILNIAASIGGNGSALVKSVGSAGTKGTVIFSGTNDYAGGTTIENAILQVNNGSSLGSGAVNVTSGALVVKNGANLAAASGISVASGALIDATDVVGNFELDALTLLAGSNINVEIASAGAGPVDLLDVSGLLDIREQVNITFLTPPGQLTDRAYVFASYGQLGDGRFDPAAAPDGYRFDYSYKGNNIALVSEVPVPAPLLLMGLGALIMAGTRRVRR